MKSNSSYDKMVFVEFLEMVVRLALAKKISVNEILETLLMAGSAEL
jgi:hypothetical protein